MRDESANKPVKLRTTFGVTRSRLAQMLRPGMLLVHCGSKDYWLIEQKEVIKQSGQRAKFLIRSVRDPRKSDVLSFTKLIMFFSLVSTPDDNES